MDPLARFSITPQLLKATAEIDEFKGRWAALGHLAPERLSALRRIAGRGTSRRWPVTPS